MKENLKVTKLRDGTPISNSHESSKQDPVLMGPNFVDIEEPRAWIYNDDPRNNDKYGKLYNWYAVNTGQLCPKGWHIPTVKEWEELQKTLGWKEASKLMRTSDWKGVKTTGTNQSGFTALAAGYATQGGTYFYITEQAYFWSSSPGLSNENYSDKSGAAVYLFTDEGDCPKSGSVTPVNRYKISGISCRCVADDPNISIDTPPKKGAANHSKTSPETKGAVVKYQSSMIPGDRLSENEKLISANARYQLRATTDGNFVIEEVQPNNSGQLREIYRFPLVNGGSRPSVSFFSFNPDGNICMDTPQGKTYCATTGRDLKAAAILSKGLKLLELTNTGILRLINDKGQQIWSAN